MEAIVQLKCITLCLNDGYSVKAESLRQNSQVTALQNRRVHSTFSIIFLVVIYAMIKFVGIIVSRVLTLSPTLN